MSADEAYGSGRDAGERRVARALIPAPCYARVPYTALLPICRPPTHYCRLVYPVQDPRCVLAPGETAYLIPRP